MKWEAVKLNRNVHRLNLRLKNAKDIARILLRSDAHHDNPHADNDLERKHLEEALAEGSPIIDNGDAFCAMQGKWDRRKSKQDLKPEHLEGDYLDSLVSTYAAFLKPYAKNLAVMATGNHETGILKHHETNLTTRLVERLNTMTGARIYDGSYTGWVFFSLYSANTKNVRGTIRLWRTHGEGGGSPVTRGVITTARRAVYLPDADIVLAGHTHHEWQVPIQRLRVTSKGKVYQDEQLHVQLPSYKDEYKDGYSYGNWAIERGMPPKPVGAAWLEIWIDNDQPCFRVVRAK